MAAVTGAIKVQICALIEQSATIVTELKKVTGKNALIEMLRGSAGMTEIANEPKLRSKLLRARELLESFIAHHGRPAQRQTAE